MPAGTPWYERVVNQANRIKAAVPRMGTVGFQDTSQGAPEAPTKVGRYFVYPEGRVVHTTGVEVRADTDMKRELIETAKRIKAIESAAPSERIGTVRFQDLEPEQRERLEAGVKEIFASHVNGTDSEALTKDLVAEFGGVAVQAALAVVTGSSESTDQ